MSQLVRRARTDRSGVDTKPIVIFSVSYGLIGVTALGAAVFRSGVLLGIVVALTLAHVVVRTILSRRSGS